MRKRATSAIDVIFISVLIFCLAMGIFMSHFISTKIQAGLLANKEINSSNSTVTAINNMEKTQNRFDYLMLAVFIGIALGTIIIGWMIGGLPIFMVFYFFGIIVAAMLSFFLSNAYEGVSTLTIFGATVNSLPITSHLLLNLPIYVCIIGFIGIVTMFAKPYLAGNF